MMTPPREDLPSIGDEIAVLHSSGQWYSGPLTVTDVDTERPSVTGRRTLFSRAADRVTWPAVPYELSEVHDGTLGKIRWNLVADLSDAERAPFDAHAERVARYYAGRPR